MNNVSLIVYNSRFLKADRRTVIGATGGQTYRTDFEQQACLDDLFLLPGAALTIAPTGLACQMLILPIAGGGLLTTAHESERALLPGYIYTVPAGEPTSFTLTNPFEKETVNLLLIQAAVPAAVCSAVQEFHLPLTAKNTLVASESPGLPVRVGLYDSRVKGTIAPSSSADFSLCYVINGSFEIEDRLVEHRDALLLWELPAIDFEALSETAILFYLAFSKTR